jgi:penicillin-binding protein 1C
MRLLRFLRAHVRAALAASAILSLSALALWLRLGPIPGDLLDDDAYRSTVVLDRRGVPLYEALSEQGTRGITLAADNLPPALVAATVAAEDRRYWSHPGVDPIALLRALQHNLAERQIVEGGSTITQQVAKLLLNRRDPRRHRGVRAKIAEARLALRLEHRFGKREILAMYLNLAGYGNQIAGAERASLAYFGRTAAMLTPAQAAFLAGLPQRPSGFNPYRSRAAAISRQRVVLRRMEAAGALTAGQAREAREERLAFTHLDTPFLAPHFVAMVLEQVRLEPTAEQLRRPAPAGPAVIETTLDSELQQDINGIIRSNRALLERHGAANVAVVVLDSETGEWLAWEGSGNYFDGEHGGTINGPVMPRQPGSALKPFTYALAFEEGFTPATVLPDIPSHFPTAQDGVVYSPRNYDGVYRGPLLARRALAGSENVPAVALASDVGVPKLLRFLLRSGFSTFDRNASYYGLGVTLGNAEVRLDELVGAYAAFARGGEWIAPTWRRSTPDLTASAKATAVRRSFARTGKVGPANTVGAAVPLGGPTFRSGEDTSRATRPVVSRRTAFWITDILSDPEAREYIFGRGGNLEFPFPVAVKTGTSQAYHDNWTVGYTRHVTVGVWVGNFDRTPLRDSSGVTGAGPIFHAVMLAAERRATGLHDAGGDDEIVAPPDGVTRYEICALSGLAASPWCPSRQLEWLPAADPLPSCDWHHRADDGLLVVWPPEFRDWAKQNRLLADRPRPRTAQHPSAPFSTPRHSSALRESLPRGPLEIVNPPTGATYLIDPTLRRDFQTLSFKAVSDGAGPVIWAVDGRDVGKTARDGAFSWPLAAGAHRIVARDGRGNSAEALITVR